MHDIRAIRDNPDAFDRDLARRGLAPLSAELIALDLLAQADKQPDGMAGLPPEARAELLDDVRAQIEELTTLIGDLVELARDHPLRIVVGGEIDAMARCYSELLTRLRAGRTGVLLCPDADLHGALLHATLPRLAARHSPLVVLEELRHVVALEVEGHAVRPLERGAARRECVDGLAQELHLDPRQLRRELHLLHLLLRACVEVAVEARRLLVVCVAVEVLRREDQQSARRQAQPHLTCR